MKAILSTVMVVMLSLGVYASPKNSGEKVNNNPDRKFKVEILDVSPEFKAGENGTIEMSSAFIAKQTNSSEELFGSFWAEFDYKKGNSNGIYKVENWDVKDIRLAEDLTQDEAEQIKSAFYNELASRFNEFPKSEIDNVLNDQNHIISGFNNEAPPIIYTNQPSALIVIDGDPYYEVLDSRFSRISNAAAFIVKDNKKEVYYMYGGGLWFSSDNVLEGWEYNSNVPGKVSRIMKKHARDLYDSMQNEQFQSRIVPDIIVTTEPAELISTNGKPKFVLIPNTNLGYAENSDAELFRDLNSNRFYALFSGRWFVSDKLEGNWQYVAQGKLPKDFANIPETHDKSNVLVSVPGTKAAINAVRDAQVPNITKKDINTILSKTIEYNGEPEFAAIEGTDLSYAVNTSNPVLLWNNRYYLVDDAVWYNSSSPYGPWQIATMRPVGVENIPANNPLYNIKYVHVYKNTDRVVYTGYTSGYTGSYVYGPTVVFGTGFHYYGWHGHYYYHHPMTYGFGFFYDPFYGWIPVYSPWYHSSFYWHWNSHWYWNWHWHWHWHGYRPPVHRPPHHRPKPENPIERPGRPSNIRPEQPMERPGRPTTLPAEPDRRPTQPSVRPTQPNVRPSQPDIWPDQPAVRPTQPAPMPSQPSFRPSQPSSRPAPPASRPAPAPAQMR